MLYAKPLPNQAERIRRTPPKPPTGEQGQYPIDSRMGFASYYCTNGIYNPFGPNPSSYRTENNTSAGQGLDWNNHAFTGSSSIKKDIKELGPSTAKLGPVSSSTGTPASASYNSSLGPLKESSSKIGDSPTPLPAPTRTSPLLKPKTIPEPSSFRPAQNAKKTYESVKEGIKVGRSLDDFFETANNTPFKELHDFFISKDLASDQDQKLRRKVIKFKLTEMNLLKPFKETEVRQCLKDYKGDRYEIRRINAYKYNM